MTSLPPLSSPQGRTPRPLSPQEAASRKASLLMEYASQCEAELARRKVKSESGRKFYELYPDTGPLRRGLYEKHIEFFQAGSRHNERAFIGGNRTGKSFCMSYEGVCHMTGDYPAWWEGRWQYVNTVILVADSDHFFRQSRHFYSFLFCARNSSS